ncbi:hypothetical protein [Herbidospora sp. RD11066]
MNARKALAVTALTLGALGAFAASTSAPPDAPAIAAPGENMHWGNHPPE